MQRSKLSTRLLLSIFLLGFSFACSDGDPPSGDETEGALLPWAEGNRWTYRVTDDNNVVTTKITTVHALEPVGGVGPNKDVMAHKVVTEKDDGADETHSWQNVVGDKVVRYREVSFGMTSNAVNLEEHWQPFKLRVDGASDRTVEGPPWFEQYYETKIRNGVAGADEERRDLWQVIKQSERVSVPAGEFDALVVQRTSGSSSAKQYWFVRGVGKVKETGGQTEELVSYDVAD